MRSAPFLLAALLASAAPALAQRPVWLSARVGAAQYALGDLHTWQNTEQEGLNTVGIPVEATQSFPPYLALGAEVKLGVMRGHRLGLVARYGSTGGRLHYADYSGEVEADWTVRRRSAGLLWEVDAVRLGFLHGLLALHVLADAGRVRYAPRIRLEDPTVSVTQAPPLMLENRSVSFEPEVGVERRAGRFGFRVRGGVGVSFGGALEAGGDPVFLEASEQRVHARWTGWRFGFSVGYRLRGT